MSETTTEAKPPLSYTDSVLAEVSKKQGTAVELPADGWESGPTEEVQEAIGAKPKEAAAAPKTETKTEAKPVVSEEIAKLHAEIDIPAPVTKPADVPAEEVIKDEAPKNLSPKAADSFAQIKKRANAEIAQREALLKQRDQELAKYKSGTVVDPTEIEAIRKERDEFSKRLEEVSLESHPKFKAHYDGRIESAIADAKGIAGGAADKVTQLLRLPDSAYKSAQMAEAMADMDDFQKAQLGALVIEIKRIQKERSDKLADAPNQHRAMREYEAKEKEVAAAKHKEAFQSVMAKASAGYEVLSEIEGRDDWNANVRKLKGEAETLFAQDKSPADLAAMAVKAVSADRYRALFQSTRNLVKAYQKQIAELSAAGPSISGGASKDAPAADPNMSYVDKVMADAAKAGFLK